MLWLLYRVKKTFTLTELLTVIIIISILILIGVPSYRKAILKARDREAQAMLKLIKEAERSYYIDYDDYVACTDVEDCNAKLGLDLPSQYWDYEVDTNPTGDQFCAHAKGVPNQTLHSDWYISEAMDKPSPSGCTH